MGEAKRRRAQAGNAQAGEQNGGPRSEAERQRINHNIDLADYVGIISDRSGTGEAVLREWQKLFPDLRDKVAAWHELGFQFFVHVRLKNATPGGRTVMARDQAELLGQALPAAVEKVNASGGFCAFMIATDPALAPMLEARLAELQRPLPGSGMQ